jgi:hypothetical protein
MQTRQELLSDIFWGTLSLFGVLAATGCLALGFRLSLGNW